eukprot:TRINITY_DN2489_c0_g1_i1.p1 TRINITY_DN2489_c0_g1~~TRINITY_DN2489_c0_g1_i1.p1  ORF type:complete len:124 (+),score=23.11 TRINITY_DN2489_c0_g1_i1:138-509(+)
MVLLRKKGQVKLVHEGKVKGDIKKNFAVICENNKIRFWVGVVHLQSGESPEDSHARTEELKSFIRNFGRYEKMVLAGDFNQDLSKENALSTYLLKTMNGIDHNQEEPLAFTVNKTRTNCSIRS